MTENEFKGGIMRMQSYQKLKIFLSNPGKFCLIVLGSRGAGKHFAIERAFSEIKNSRSSELCLKSLAFINPDDFPMNAGKLNQLFSLNKFKTLVVEDVEELSELQQKLLFKALSTKDGTFGIGVKHKLRIIFTSSKEIDVLRTDQDLLLGYFWDRISQLIVEFPSFKIENEHIIEDFYSTWDKMEFMKTKGFAHFAGEPKNATLEKFLSDYAEKFEGGFRDLDKLACMYFNYRIFYYESKKKIEDSIEKKIVESIKEDFISKSQLHGNTINDMSLFQIRPGFSMDDLNAQFRIQVRKWAWKEYGTLGKAEIKLSLKKGTLKNYVFGKATKKQKTNDINI